jgi:hypothetical protein
MFYVLNYFIQLRVSPKGLFGSRWPSEYDISHPECQWQAFQFFLCISYIFLHIRYQVRMPFQHFQDKIKINYFIKESICSERLISFHKSFCLFLNFIKLQKVAYKFLS